MQLILFKLEIVIKNRVKMVTGKIITRETGMKILETKMQIVTGMET